MKALLVALFLVGALACGDDSDGDGTTGDGDGDMTGDSGIGDGAVALECGGFECPAAADCCTLSTDIGDPNYLAVGDGAVALPWPSAVCSWASRASSMRTARPIQPSSGT